MNNDTPASPGVTTRETSHPLVAPSDTERLNWLESTKTGIGYNVECCAWGVDFNAPYAPTLREAIDVARAGGPKEDKADATTMKEREQEPNEPANL